MIALLVTLALAPPIPQAKAAIRHWWLDPIKPRVHCVLRAHYDACVLRVPFSVPGQVEGVEHDYVRVYRGPEGKLHVKDEGATISVIIWA